MPRARPARLSGQWPVAGGRLVSGSGRSLLGPVWPLATGHRLLKKRVICQIANVISSVKLTSIRAVWALPQTSSDVAHTYAATGPAIFCISQMSRPKAMRDGRTKDQIEYVPKRYVSPPTIQKWRGGL